MTTGAIPDLSKFWATLQAQGGEIASRMADAVREQAPVGNGPTAGRLRDSITGEAQPTGDGLTIQVLSGDPVVVFVREGTGSHIITPRASKALVFVVSGATVFARRVDHPGTRPNRFEEKAADALQAIAQDAVQQALGAL